MTELGTVLDGKYEILKKVGQGGMSIVYLAMDNRLNKQWAVKEIKNDGSKSTAPCPDLTFFPLHSIGSCCHCPWMP